MISIHHQRIFEIGIMVVNGKNKCPKNTARSTEFLLVKEYLPSTQEAEAKITISSRPSWYVLGSGTASAIQ